MAVDVEQLQADVKAVKLILFGNGQPGLAEDVRKLGEVMADVTKGVDKLTGAVEVIQRDREADKNQREGGRKVLGILGAIVTLISAGGAVMTARVLDVLSRVAALP